MRATNSTVVMFLLFGVAVSCAGCVGVRCTPCPQSIELDLETVTDHTGSILYQEYMGERIFTDCNSTNSSGINCLSIYCGERAPGALVHRRVYMSAGGVIVRSEAITTDNPMLMSVDIYDPQTGERIERRCITQGNSKKFYRAYLIE